MYDDFYEWWGWYLTDEEMRREEEERKKQLDALLSYPNGRLRGGEEEMGR